VSPLRCPHCGGDLSVEMETRGSAYLTYEAVESIECQTWECSAAWDQYGEPLREPKPS
jgi:hypothetical protein